MYASAPPTSTVRTRSTPRTRSKKLLGSLAGALSLTVLSAFSPPAALQLTTSQLNAFSFSQSAQAQDLPPIPIQFNPDTLVNPGRPGGRRRGGGSRGSCQADRPLTAIAYAQSTTTEELGVTSTTERVGSLTTQATPTLLFYIPQPVQESTIELIVQSSSNEVLFQGQLAGETDGNGIVSVPMPINLEPNEAYHWFLTLDCDESEIATVDGWIEHRAANADLRRTFSQANARNRVALYANYGFVQDSLSELAALRLANPDDEVLAQEWRSFLDTLGLSELTDVPIFDCCQVADAPMPEEEIPEEREPEVLDPVETEPEEAPERRTILQRARDRG